MNHLSNGQIAIGAEGSKVREEQLDEIAKAEAIRLLELPEGHEYGRFSNSARFVNAFIEGARWQRSVTAVLLILLLASCSKSTPTQTGRCCYAVDTVPAMYKHH